MKDKKIPEREGKKVYAITRDLVEMEKGETGVIIDELTLDEAIQKGMEYLKENLSGVQKFATVPHMDETPWPRVTIIVYADEDQELEFTN